MTYAPTLDQEPELAMERAVKPYEEPFPAMIVHAPCCGRRTTADAIVDVRSVPGTVCCAGGTQPERDHDWLCDGCRSRMYREPGNPWTCARLMQVLGAPWEEVRVMRATERVREMRQETFKRGEVFRPVEARARALSELPAEQPVDLLAQHSTT